MADPTYITPLDAPNVLSAFKRAANKWAQIDAMGISPAVTAPLVQQDIKTVAKGGTPMTLTQTLYALQAGAQGLQGRSYGPEWIPTGQAPLEPKKPSFWQRMRNDALTIAKGFVTAPIALFQTGGEIEQELRHGFSGFRQNEAAAGGGARGFLTALTQEPGINLIPGTREAGALIGGHPGEIADHPLISLIDVLPYANEAVKAIDPEIMARAVREVRSPLRQAIHESYYAAERAVIDKWPKQAFNVPSELIKRWGAGSVIRKAWQALGRPEHEFVSFIRQHDEIANRLIGDWARAKGLKGTDANAAMAALFHKAEGTDPAALEAFAKSGYTKAPDWWGELSDVDRTFLQKFNALLAPQYQDMLKNGNLFVVDGETYDRSDKSNADFYKAFQDKNATVSQIIEHQQKIKDLTEEEAQLRAASELGEASRKLQAIKTREGQLAKAQDRLMQRTNRLNKLATTKTPARYRSLVVELAKEEFAKTMSKELPQGSPALEAALAKIHNGFFSEAGLPKEYVEKTIQDIAHNWRALRSAGWEPMYLPHVFASDMGKITFPKISPDYIARPEVAKERTFDMRASMPDFRLAADKYFVQAEAPKWVRASAQQLIDNKIALRYEGELQDRIMRAGGTREGTGPIISANFMVLDTRVKSEGEMIRPATERTQYLDQQGVYLIPKRLGEQLAKLYGRDVGKFAQSIRIPREAFFISVLGISPMFVAHGTIGTAVMLMSETGPTAFRDAGLAWKIAKAGWKGDESLPELNVPPEVAMSTRMDGLMEYMRGKELGKFFNQPAGQKVYQGMKTFEQKYSAFRVVKFAGDMAKVMAYKYGERFAKEHGLSPAEAEHVGLEEASRILVDYNKLTPFERTSLKTVFPFYNFASHIVRMAIRLPFDHPWRVSIIANLASAEMADWSSAIPANLQKYLMIGSPNAQGKIKAYSLTGIDPFMNLYSYFSAAGFFSHLNPGLQAIGSWLGIDKISANAELYPSLTFNPDTGRLEAKRPSIWGALLPSIAEQFDLWFRWQDIQKLRKTDPAAANREIFNLLHVPWPVTLDLAQQAEYQNEAQYRLAKQALSGVKRGQYGLAEENFPQLAPLIQQMQRQGIP